MNLSYIVGDKSKMVVNCNGIEATYRLNEIANQFVLQQLSTIDDYIPNIQRKDQQIQHAIT